MNTKPLRVVLVSVGSFGSRYLSEMTENDTGGILAGVVEPAPGLEARCPVILDQHIPVYSSLEAFYAAEQADLAIICSPIHLHSRMVMTALINGSNVLCEKPLCVNEDETKQLAALAEERKLILALGWQLNYDPAIQQIKQSILEGCFGKPVRGRCIHAMRRGKKYYSRNNWSGRISVDGLPVLDSPFMNGCAHNFQLMTYLLGKSMPEAEDIVRVEGELYRANDMLENYDIAFLRCTTEHNIPLLYLAAHPVAAKNLGQIAEIEFEKGVLSWGQNRVCRFDYSSGKSPVIYGKGKESYGLSLQKLYDVIDCVKTGRQPMSQAKTGLPHLHAVFLAQQLPIQQIDKIKLEHLALDDDRFICVPNLETVMMDSYLAWSLPREIGLHI